MEDPRSGFSDTTRCAGVIAGETRSRHVVRRASSDGANSCTVSWM